MAYDERQLRRIDLIDQQTLVRCLSPELMLVDPELASLARELLRDPGETNGKGRMSALLGTHDVSASSGIGFSLEPPLSPPVVRGPMDSPMASSAPMHQEDLPTPPAPAPEPEPEPEIVAPEPVVLPTMAPPEPALLPVTPPELAPEPAPAEVALPEIEPVTLTPPPAPAPVEAPPAAEVAPEIAPV